MAFVLLASSPAAAQEAVAVKFTERPLYNSEYNPNAWQTPEYVKEDAGKVTAPVSVLSNPTTGSFRVSLKGTKEDPVKVKVVDRHGCIKYIREVSGQAELRFGYWYYPGTYTMHVIQGDSYKTIKLQKRAE